MEDTDEAPLFSLSEAFAAGSKPLTDKSGCDRNRSYAEYFETAHRLAEKLSADNPEYVSLPGDDLEELRFFEVVNIIEV